MRQVFETLINDRRNGENPILDNKELKWLSCYLSDVKSVEELIEWNENEGYDTSVLFRDVPLAWGKSIMEAMPYDEYAKLCDSMLKKYDDLENGMTPFQKDIKDVVRVEDEILDPETLAYSMIEDRSKKDLGKDFYVEFVDGSYWTYLYKGDVCISSKVGRNMDDLQGVYDWLNAMGRKYGISLRSREGGQSK